MEQHRRIRLDPEPSVSPYRVFRGGWWFSGGGYCRSTHRRVNVQVFGLSLLGVRVTLEDPTDGPATNTP